MQIAEEFAFDQYFNMHSIEWYRHARHDRQRLVENGELVLITDTYEEAGWGKLASHPTMKGGANQKKSSISFCQERGRLLPLQVRLPPLRRSRISKGAHNC